MTAKKTPKNINFDDAIVELETCVKQLESGKLPLEEALTVFQDGIRLSSLCLQKLDSAKQTVEKIVLESDDSFKTEAFEENNNDF